MYGDSINQDDFYVVLPSNACPDIHPSNKASDYTVSWQHPIILDDVKKWKVAMTEISFNHVESSINTYFGIRYVATQKDSTQFKVDFSGLDTTLERWIIPPDDLKHPDPQSYFTTWPTMRMEVRNGKLSFRCYYPFVLRFPNIKVANAFGMEMIEITSEIVEGGKIGNKQMYGIYSKQNVITPEYEKHLSNNRDEVPKFNTEKWSDKSELYFLVEYVTPYFDTTIEYNFKQDLY